MKTVYEILGIHKSRDKTTENVDNRTDKGTSVLKGKFKIQKSEDEKRLAFGWANISIDAVSYTHLDVYKRQDSVIKSRREQNGQ